MKKNESLVFKNEMRLVESPDYIYLLTRNRHPMICHFLVGVNYPEQEKSNLDIGNTTPAKIEIAKNPEFCTSRCPNFLIEQKQTEQTDYLFVHNRCGVGSSHSIMELVRSKETKTGE